MTLKLFGVKPLLERLQSYITSTNYMSIEGLNGFYRKIQLDGPMAQRIIQGLNITVIPGQ